jgi:hypothetical protein
MSTIVASVGPKLPKKARPSSGEEGGISARATGTHYAQEIAYASAKKLPVWYLGVMSTGLPACSRDAEHSSSGVLRREVRQTNLRARMIARF